MGWEYETFLCKGGTISAFEGLLVKHEVKHISTLDSLRGTCKDPTGTVKTSVHHKTIDHLEIGPHLKVGSVKILQDVFGSDIGWPTDDLVRLSIPIVNNKPPTRSVDDILTKLISPLHSDKPEGSGSNKNNKNATN
ncbi:hypothetical protein LR48_Vigan10g276900 [Vigna angularis]|uniref:Uncharacterized protein n=1 Tax=Phaseolus angularis TaxID=3914 RepID=A0A0L9VPP9_PHAAN|nr:uncharacterized protein HKW66_Vig0126410 [Vigna angularis]KOM56877.1 hypothetical protein LR48_Vigan10g276900 [Vigna angularis]